MRKPFTGVSNQVGHKLATRLDRGLESKRDCTIYGAKNKGADQLRGCTADLSAFVFASANSSFSHSSAQLVLACQSP